MQQTHEEQLTVEELAARLKVAPSWVYKQTRQRRIPFRRAGKYLRFEWTAVDKWMQQQAE